MKNILLVLAALFFVFLVAGCAGDESSQGDEGQDEDEAVTQQYQEEEPDYLLQEEEEDASAASLEEGATDEAGISGYMPEGSALEGEPYSIMEASPTFPANDRRYLCGAATNIFVGEVTAEVGNDPLAVDVAFDDATAQPPVPQTQYTVTPDTNESQPKGSIGSAPITVNQIGGQVNPEDTLEVLNGDPPLEVGITYLFAVEYDSTNDWYTIVMQPYGDIKQPADLARTLRDFKTACRYERAVDEAHAEANDSMEANTQDQYAEEE